MLRAPRDAIGGFRISEPPPPSEHSRHHTKDKQRFIVSVVAYDSLPGHHFIKLIQSVSRVLDPVDFIVSIRGVILGNRKNLCVGATNSRGKPPDFARRRQLGGELEFVRKLANVYWLSQGRRKLSRRSPAK